MEPLRWNEAKPKDHRTKHENQACLVADKGLDVANYEPKPVRINDSPFEGLNLSETADSCTFCAKNLARRARWQSDSPNILWLSQLQFLTAAKVRRSRSSLPETMQVKRNPLRRHN